MGEFADCYRRAESRESSSLYVRGLLADKIARKNCWQLADTLKGTRAVGLERPKPLERLLNEGDWEADEVCQRLRGLIKEQFSFVPGVGVIDESGPWQSQGSRKARSQQG